MNAKSTILSVGRNAPGPRGKSGGRGRCTSEQGLTGPQGPQGKQGGAGGTGPVGNNGNRGDPGDQGITGITGPVGSYGPVLVQPWLVQGVLDAGVTEGVLLGSVYTKRAMSIQSGPNTTDLTMVDNVVTIQPGTWSVRASAPAYSCDAHQIVLNVGGNRLSGLSQVGTALAQTRSGIFEVITVDTPTRVWFETYAKVSGTDATLGLASNGEHPEVYTSAAFTKLL